MLPSNTIFNGSLILIIVKSYEKGHSVVDENKEAKRKERSVRNTEENA